MRKSIKNFIAIFILVLGVSFLPTTTLAKTNIPSATSDFYVNDFANVFSTDEKARLMDNAITLSNEYDGIQLVITTIESLGDNTIESYALDMYNQYGIGKNDMGLLILLSTGDRQIRVEVGKAMEAYINDSKAGRFIDQYAIPYLKENKFNDGLINLQEAFITEIAEITDNENSENLQSTVSDSNIDFLSIIGIFLVICIVFVLIFLIRILARKLIAKSKEKQQTIDTLTEELEISRAKVIEVQNAATQEINSLHGKIDVLVEDKNSLATKYQILKNKYLALEDRYSRVQILYPSADKEVTDMIKEEIRKRDISLAKEVDSIIQEVINLPASKDILPLLHNAQSHYSSLSLSQQSYVKSDINKLNQLYNKCSLLKQEYDRLMEEQRRKELASDAVSSITAIISCMTVGKSKHLKKLKEAKSIYDNLDSVVRKYFDKSVADKLDKLYREAKQDKEKEEEEERIRKRREEEERRRSMQNDSYSSFGSGSHYGGFGGHSGGGGASRGF